MLKKEARKEYRQKRNALSLSEKDRLDDLLLIQFQAAGVPAVQSLLSYWPIEENNEPNTHLFSEYLRFKSPELRLLYPVSNFETGEMVAMVTDIDTPFEKAALNILEPSGGWQFPTAEIDMVFVPLLAFDKQGYRVGYGKGFYDRFIEKCKPDCLKIGFSYFEPLPRIQDLHEFDVPLDLCVTPSTTYVF